MKIPLSRPLTAALTSTALLALTACGATVDNSAEGTEITTHSCGVEQKYPRPQRPVAYDVSSIEKMFSLGLAEQMRGIVLPKTIKSAIDKSPYKEDYAKVDMLSDDVLSQEVLVNAQADWAMAGWQGGFSQERGVTPESLQKVGINSYLQEETCFDYDAAGRDAEKDPIAAMYKDIEHLGEIFQVEDRAGSVVAGLKKREQALLKNTKEFTPRPRVFIYDSGTDSPYTAGKHTALNSVVELAGGKSVTADVNARFTSVGWEPVVKAEPEEIVVIDYNKQPVEEKIRFLTQESPLKNSPAVRAGRIHVIDYGEAVSSPRNIDAAESLSHKFSQPRKG